MACPAKPLGGVLPSATPRRITWSWNSFAFQTAPSSLGAFTDFSQFNFLDVGPAPDESPALTERLSLSGELGVGSFRIAPTAQPGTTTGEITMTYDLYASDPALYGGSPLQSGLTLSVPATIIVTAAPVPEPASFPLLLLSASVAILVRRAAASAK